MVASLCIQNLSFHYIRIVFKKEFHVNKVSLNKVCTHLSINYREYCDKSNKEVAVKISEIYEVKLESILCVQMPCYTCSIKYR